ncbi:MAG: hypothetical protein GX220_02115 [Treponema sp.]|nr:hypothetical protein [Treponema sp.]
MNETKCNKKMDLFYSLDKNENLPLQLSLHLLICKKCRSTVRALTEAEKSCAMPLQDMPNMNNETLLKIMQKIDSDYKYEDNIEPVSLKGWVIAGTILIMSLLFFTMFKNFALSSSLSIIIYLIYAIIVTVYCAFFIAVNLDFFIKQIDKIPQKYFQQKGQ